jgi:invasion protein IalB
MPVTKTAQFLATSLCLLLGSAALAQDSASPEASGVDALSMGREEGAAEAPAEGGIGSTYIAETHGDWEQRCVRTEDGADPCQLYQLLRDAEQNPVAEISVFGLAAGQQAAAGATIIVPLETLLTQDVTLQVDTANAKKYPFSWCSNIGCIARIGFTAAEVDAFRKGNSATIAIVPVVAPDKQVKVQVSLKGFTAGYEAVNKANGN